MRIPIGFRFHEASDPQPAPQKEEKVTLDQRLKTLQEADNELYSAVFGKGVTKGKKEVTEDHLQEAVDERYQKAHKALAEERIHRVLLEKAREQGFLYPEDVADLLRTALTLNDNLDIVYASTGERVSVDDAVKDIAKVKPHWVKSRQRPGSGSTKPVNPDTSGNPDKPKFKRSQLKDHSFYTAHEKEIMDAIRDHRIINDVE
ncbi:MAG: hypothetical protein KBE65_23450 [Phycisphaerae bacterium]|nr:hypothetical protein [Phycisphaerae bacterium]